jgi:chromosome segregation ATPase
MGLSTSELGRMLEQNIEYMERRFESLQRQINRLGGGSDSSDKDNKLRSSLIKLNNLYNKQAGELELATEKIGALERSVNSLKGSLTKVRKAIRDLLS